MASPVDSFFECLTKRRRRIVLSYLLTIEDRPVTIDELADSVSEAERSSSSPSLPPSLSSDLESVAITLDHVHLPLLADAGFIEYDRERGLVTTTNQTPDIEPYLDRVQNASQLEELTAKRRGNENDPESR